MLLLLLMCLCLLITTIIYYALRKPDYIKLIRTEMYIVRALQPLLPPASTILGSTPIFYINMAAQTARRSNMEEAARRLGISNLLIRAEGVDVRSRFPTTERITFNQPLKVCVPPDTDAEGAGEICFIIPTVYNGTFDRGELGCLLGHLVVWRRALVAGYDSIFVAEDDIWLDMLPTWPWTAAELIANGPEGWKLINLGPDRKGLSLKEHPDLDRFFPPRSAAHVAGYDRTHHFDTNFYIVRRSAMAAAWGWPPTQTLTLQYHGLPRLVADIYLYLTVPSYSFSRFPTVPSLNLNKGTQSNINSDHARRELPHQLELLQRARRYALPAAWQALRGRSREISSMPLLLHKLAGPDMAVHYGSASSPPAAPAPGAGPAWRLVWWSKARLESAFGVGAAPPECLTKDGLVANAEECLLSHWSETHAVQLLLRRGGMLWRRAPTAEQLETAKHAVQSGATMVLVLDPQFRMWPASGPTHCNWVMLAAAPEHPFLQVLAGMVIENELGSLPGKPRSIAHALELLGVDHRRPVPTTVVCDSSMHCRDADVD